MIFKPAARYPADPRAVFILALSVFSGATALALNAAPDDLNSLLPSWGVVIWGALLTLGSFVTLLGMAFQTVNGIVLEQVGSVTVGVTTIFYASLAFWQLGPDALAPVSIVLAWGIACFIRWVQLQILINSAVKRKEKRALLDRLEEDLLEHRRREELKREQEQSRLRRWGH